MANTHQAKKKTLQIIKRTARNHARISRVRTFLRKLDEAISTNDKEAAKIAFANVQPELHRAVSKGVLHRNTVARKLSRLSNKVRLLA